MPVLVKAYAFEFCGAKALREATREQVENFVAHIADWAEKDRNALLCHLNNAGAGLNRDSKTHNLNGALRLVWSFFCDHTRTIPDEYSGPRCAYFPR